MFTIEPVSALVDAGDVDFGGVVAVRAWRRVKEGDHWSSP